MYRIQDNVTGDNLAKIWWRKKMEWTYQKWFMREENKGRVKHPQRTLNKILWGQIVMMTMMIIIKFWAAETITMYLV